MENSWDEIKFTTGIVAECLDINFSDERVCVAARTSTAGANSNPAANAGLINALMRDRHGTPFEHMSATWKVTAPLFVWREHHRHRIASYNEESARYKVLNPIFYIPSQERHLVQIGKAMEYKTIEGTEGQYLSLINSVKEHCVNSYNLYEELLDLGIMREVARMVLPVNIMSTCIVTMNCRGLMNFLSLRVRDDEAKFPSKPQYEIDMLARQYERDFAASAPLVHAAFVKNGRVAP